MIVTAPATNAIGPAPGPATREPGAPHPPRVWGADPLHIHDAYWASRCVQVVRNGGRDTVSPEGPALYLLLPPGAMVFFDLKTPLDRMHWSAPGALRLTVRETAGAEGSERVVADEHGIAIRREYRRHTLGWARAWLTSNAETAALWNENTDHTAAIRQLKRRISREARDALDVGGLAAARGRRGDRIIAAILRAWQAPNAVFRNTYEYQSGVWAHESSRIDPTARLVAPVWVGAGADVPRDTVVVGPAVLADAPDQRPPGPGRVPWAELRSLQWRLPSLAGRDQPRRILKRAFDIAFSLAVLAATLPLYPLLALLIFLEDGRPIFFAHRRQTLAGRDFPCLKFRTMVRDAERLKAQLREKNQADGPQFFIEDDPRLLRIGRTLRKYQLDELPQFINVLIGHMSVVGPRPSPDRENQYCPAWREARLSVRPGVTGLWQVRRTREPLTDFQEWIRYDLEYVQHQSIPYDLKIIWLTVKHIIARDPRPEAERDGRTPAGTNAEEQS